MAHFVQIGDMAFNPDQICKIEWFNPKDGLCLEVTFTSGLHMFSIAETESFCVLRELAFHSDDKLIIGNIIRPF